MPLLETMQRLPKFAQGLQILIYDFVSAMKLAKIDVFSMYCDVETKFFPPHHLFFLELVDHYNNALFLV
jgi:hypothetical protein